MTVPEQPAREETSLEKNPEVRVLAADAVPLLPYDQKPHIAVSLALGHVIRIESVRLPDESDGGERRFMGYLRDIQEAGIKTLMPTFARGKSIGGKDMRYTSVDHVRQMIDFKDVIEDRDQTALAKYDALLVKMTRFAKKRIDEGGDNFADLLSLRQYVLDTEVSPVDREPILVDVDIIGGESIPPANERDIRKLRSHVVDQIIDFINDYYRLQEVMDRPPLSSGAIESFITDCAAQYPSSITPEISERLLLALRTNDSDLVDILDDPDQWWYDHDVLPYY